MKIDKSFVNRIHDSDLDQSILKGILYFISELDLDLIVEGVESLEQLRSLVKMGCRSFQGFYFSASLGEKEFIEYRKMILGKEFSVSLD